MEDCIQQKSKISEHAIKDCIFCKIINGEIPCTKVYEDGDVLAFLDIAPVNKGHTLVIPKEHYERLADISDDLYALVANTVRKISQAVMKAAETDGCTVIQSDGKTGGQLVPHLHMHVIPRLKDDSLKFWPQGKYEEGEADRVAEKIKKSL